MGLILSVRAGHNASACIGENGQIRHAVQEERLNGEKNYWGFPKLAVRACIEAVGAKPRDVEAVAVCLLWSIANPEHELALGRLIQSELPDVPFTLSHQLNPVMREYRRTSCTAIDASLKPLMQAHLREVTAELRQLGYTGEMLAANSLGGVMPVEDLANAPI